MIYEARNRDQRGKTISKWMNLEDRQVQLSIFFVACIGLFIQTQYDNSETPKVNRILNYNQSPNLNWGQRRLLEAYGSLYKSKMDEGAETLVNPFCYKRYLAFGEAVGEYDKCVLDKSFGLNSICLTCHDKYKNTLEAFKVLSEVLKEPIGPYKSCTEMFINQNEMNILARELERIYSIHGVWAKANCRFCFLNDEVMTGQVKFEVHEFMGHADHVHSCFGGNYTRADNGTYLALEGRTRCDDCSQHLQTMHKYYNSVWGGDKKKSTYVPCDDVLKMFNMTLNIWNEEIQCNVNWTPTEIYLYPSVISVAILVYVVFAVIVAITRKFCGCQYPPILLRIACNQVVDPNVHNVQLEEDIDEALGAVPRRGSQHERAEVRNGSTTSGKMSVASSGSSWRKNPKSKHD